MNKISIKELSHSYSKLQVLKNINLDIEEGEIHCILGPSGCGKSTLLKCLAGFENPNSGLINIDSIDVFNKKNIISAENRNIALVFQDNSLFPHMSIEKNISLGLKVQKSQNKEVEQLLKLVDLVGYEKKYPHELSGGEQQRVAIARSFAQRPSFILLDEPFSNLDPKLRHSLRKQIKGLLKASGTTAIFITHDREEAFQLADKISIMGDGCIQQTSTPQALVNFPVNKYVANFLNSGVIFPEDQSIVLSEANQNLYVPNKSLELSAIKSGLSFECSVESIEYTPYGHIYNISSRCPKFSNEQTSLKIFSGNEFEIDSTIWVNLKLNENKHFI